MRDMIEERGKAIADSGNAKKVTDHSFKVKSQSGRGAYEVKATPSGMTCTCPDFVYRGGKCKHIQATRYYLQVEKDTPQGTVTEKVHLTYAQAWNAYNEAQKVEVNLFDNLLKDLVKAIPEPEQTMCRPRLSLQETLFCAIQKVYSQLSSRRAHSLFQNAVERGQIDHAPRFNAPSDFFNRTETTAILHKLVIHRLYLSLESRRILQSIQLDLGPPNSMLIIERNTARRKSTNGLRLTFAQA